MVTTYELNAERDYSDNRQKPTDIELLFGRLIGQEQDSNQPRSQVLSPTRRETLVGFGHVSPRIWEITNKQLEGGADKCEICLYKAWTSRSVETSYPTLS